MANQKKKKTSTSNAAAKKSAEAPKPEAYSARPSRGENNRSDQRIPVQLLVDYRSNGNYLFDFCKDLGTGGVFIQTETPLPQGSSVDLTFTIPDSKETLAASGKVIWVQTPVYGRDDLTPGMGVQFAGFDSEQRKILENFVNRYHAHRFGKGTSSQQSA